MKTLRLNARCLASKWGFGDGGDFDYEGICLKHSTLVFLVVRHLLPLVPHVKVYHVGTAHNPIRCEDQFVEEMENSNVFVDLTEGDIEEAESFCQFIKETRW